MSRERRAAPSGSAPGGRKRRAGGGPPRSADESSPPRRPRRPRRRAPRWLGWFLALPLGVVLAVGSLLVWAVLPGPGKGAFVEVVVERGGEGGGGSELAERLTAAGVTRSPLLMRLYLALLEPMLDLAPGPHWLADSLSPRDAVQRLARLGARPTAEVTLPEGWDRLQIGRRLGELGVCSAARFLDATGDGALLADLGLPGAETAEGYLFPATYRFYVDSSPASVVERLVRESRRRLARLLDQHGDGARALAAELGWSEREVVVLASVVERESAHSDERPVVASVFLNRLTSPGFRPRRLQSDPTTAYGCRAAGAAVASCAGFSGRVTPEMNRDAANAYSTYVHDGLPPGPISNPGEASLTAVLRPAETEFFYFVADGAGRHVFSKTYAEHLAAVRAH